MTTIIGLLRHGQTDWNIAMRLQGISDIPLNQTGREQSVLASQVLAKSPWTKVISSPLTRAKETAELAAPHLSETLMDYELLLERSFGVAEGLTYDEWRDQYPTGVHPTDAESIDELTVRARKLLDSLARDFENETVLAVSHGALIRRVIHVVSNGELPPEGDRFANCSLTSIEHNGNSWTVKSYSPEQLVP